MKEAVVSALRQWNRHDEITSALLQVIKSLLEHLLCLDFSVIERFNLCDLRGVQRCERKSHELFSTN
jgi:hypothetical protein